jgi:hypothetical protein
MKIAPRFAGLKLRVEDRTALWKMQRGPKPLTPRQWRRIRVLLLLDSGHSVRAAATAAGGYPREVSRVGKSYLEGGLAKALTDEPRPKPAPMLVVPSRLPCWPWSADHRPPGERVGRWVLAEEAS